MSIDEKVRKIIADQAMVPVEEVRDDASPDDLGLDSLALVEIVFAVEEAFDISVPFNANDPERSDFDISSIRKIVSGVEKLVREQV